MTSLEPKNGFDLTIAIPTYNRNKLVERAIVLLEPQLRSNVKVVVFDNHSDIPVADTLAPYNHLGLEIIRNKENVGLSANLTKCIEHCSTKWLWILGDDDPPMDDALTKILHDIKYYEDFSFINYKSSLTPNRENDIEIIGLENFIRKIDSFGNVLYISMGVYNMEKVRGNLRTTYQFLYTNAPHLVYLFVGLNNESRILFSNKELKQNNYDYNVDLSNHKTWSWITLSLSISMLYEIPINISYAAREIFAKHILTHVKKPKEVYSILENPPYNNLPLDKKFFYYRQIFYRSLLSKGYNSNLWEFICFYIKLKAKYVVKKANNNENVDILY